MIDKDNGEINSSEALNQFLNPKKITSTLGDGAMFISSISSPIRTLKGNIRINAYIFNLIFIMLVLFKTRVIIVYDSINHKFWITKYEQINIF